MKDPLIDKKIIEMRPMTDKEMEAEGWTQPTTVLVLNNGTLLYASMDPEGNGPGYIFGTTKTGDQFGV